MVINSWSRGGAQAKGKPRRPQATEGIKRRRDARGAKSTGLRLRPGDAVGGEDLAGERSEIRADLGSGLCSLVGGVLTTQKRGRPMPRQRTTRLHTRGDVKPYSFSRGRDSCARNVGQESAGVNLPGSGFCRWPFGYTFRSFREDCPDLMEEVKAWNMTARGATLADYVAASGDAGGANVEEQACGSRKPRRPAGSTQKGHWSRQPY